MQTTLQNQTIVDAIASKIIDELNNRVMYSHESLRNEIHRFHEDCINENRIDYEDGDWEQCTFADIWSYIINTELHNLYESLEEYSQKEVRDYVRDVYPEWRYSADYDGDGDEGDDDWTPGCDSVSNFIDA